MTVSTFNSKLVLEEKKAITLFLWLFFILYYSFDAFYFYVLPMYDKSKEYGIPKEGLGIWLYILIAALLLLSIFILKKGSIFRVKFFLFYGFLLITFIDNFLTYFGHSKHFASGNAVETLFILFSPIFVNKRYFQIVSAGIIGKDLLLGVILHDWNVLSAIVFYLILGIIAYLILNRFISYVGSITTVNEELRQKERLAVIGQMAAAIGHEVRNPLAALKGFIQLQNERYPKTNEFYPIMIQEIDRINSIVNDLMYLGKPAAIQFEKASIEEILLYTVTIIHQQAERQGIVIENRIKTPLPFIHCDSNQLKQVFINLLKNAVEAMHEGGRIVIYADVLKDEKVYIAIEDEGCGMPEKIISNVGKPFLTTKREGTGLGLMVINQIIKAHNGEVNFQSSSGEGTRVEVILPITQKG